MEILQYMYLCTRLLGLQGINLSSSIQLHTYIYTNSLHFYTLGSHKYNEHTLNKQLLGLSVSSLWNIILRQVFLT